MVSRKAENIDQQACKNSQTIKAGSEFEQECLDILRDWIKENSSRDRYFDIYRLDPCPVDIILIPIQITSDDFTGLQGEHISYYRKSQFNECYFFECKDYTSAIGLSSLAKTILVAMKHSPREMTLVTTSYLEPQAHEYLEFFTNTPFFLKSRFNIWRPKSVQSEEVQNSPIISLEEIEPSMRLYSVDSAAMQVEYLFSRVLFDTKSVKQYFRNRPERVCFKFLLTHPQGKRVKKLKNAFLIVNAKSDKATSYPLCITDYKDNTKYINLECSVDGKELNAGIEYGDWGIELHYGKNNTSYHRINTLPTITITSTISELPKFREKQTLEAYNEWRMSGNPIMLVSGKSGIGKSYFCRESCRHAAKEGFVTITVSALDGSELDFIARLAWATVDSSLNNKIQQNKEVCADFIESWYLSLQGTNSSDAEKNALIELLTKGTLAGIASSALLETITRMIVHKNVPVILYAQDLHKSPPTILICLHKLITGFKNAGWGQVKLILEKREEDDAESSTLWNKMQFDFEDDIQHCDTVSSINEGEVVSELSNVFAVQDSLIIAEKLVHKSECNFQYLTVLLNTLLRQKAIHFEGCCHTDNTLVRYGVPSIPKCLALINEIPGIRKDAIVQNIVLCHDKLIKSGSEFGCLWLGIIAIIKLSPDIETLQELVKRDINIIKEELEQLRDEGMLQYRNGQYAFKHESYIEASMEWFASLNSIKVWMRKNVVHKSLPQRFSVAIAKGRIWHFLGSFEDAFEAYNAAIPLTQGSFMQRIQCHMAIHSLLLDEKLDGRHEVFFNNFFAIRSYGHYTLPISEQIELTDNAISYHNTLDTFDFSEPYYSKILFELHHNNSWLHTHNIDQEQYFISAFQAVKAATDIHSIAKMLNRYTGFCYWWGIAMHGVRGALASIVLCEEVSPQQDCDLRSVNYATSAPLITYSKAGIEGRLCFACEAIANPYASKRELVHANLALAYTLILCGNLHAADKAISFAYETMTQLSMKSVYTNYYQTKGLWYAAHNRWKEAIDAYKRALTEASLLDQHLQMLRAGHNLLVILVKNGDMAEATLLYPRLLKQCPSAALIPEYQKAEALLDAMLHKSSQFLEKKYHTQEQKSLDERMRSKANDLNISFSETIDSYASLFDIIYSTALTLSQAYPTNFYFSSDIEQGRKNRNLTSSDTAFLNVVVNKTDTTESAAIALKLV